MRFFGIKVKRLTLRKQEDSHEQKCPEKKGHDQDHEKSHWHVFQHFHQFLKIRNYMVRENIPPH